MKKYPEFPFKLRVLFRDINMQMIYTCRKSTKKKNKNIDNLC